MCIARRTGIRAKLQDCRINDPSLVDVWLLQVFGQQFQMVRRFTRNPNDLLGSWTAP